MALAASLDAELAAVEAALGQVRDLARQGAARVVAGDEPADAPLLDAAQRLEALGPALAAADGHLQELRGTAVAVRGAAAPPLPESLGPGSSDAALLAGALRQAAADAPDFIAHRRLAADALTLLEQAIAALDAGQAEAALPILDQVDVALDGLTDWQPGSDTFPRWHASVDALASAARGIADAVIGGDPDAIRAAAATYAAAAASARGADQALALAISEGGAAVSVVSLRLLAEALADLAAARAAIGSLYSGA